MTLHATHKTNSEPMAEDPCRVADTISTHGVHAEKQNETGIGIHCA